jgi:hypothetical protein
VTDSYEKGFRKILAVDELTNEPKLFRSGGAIILVIRTPDGVRAADATGCIEESLDSSRHSRLDQVAHCLGGASAMKVDWHEIVDKKPLLVEIRENDVWVCVDQCGGE